MGMMQSQVVLAVLWATAGLVTLWILGPLVLFLSPLRKYAIDIFDDPRAADAPGKDADFERRFAELKALGFVPVGKTRERFRFFTPLHWLYVSNGSRWFASPDRKTFVEIYRLAAGHPQRMTANTVFEGGGLVSTSTAPTGVGGEIGERYRRVEVGSETIADLIGEHERHVAEFSREAGLRSRVATLAELADETRVLAAPFVARIRFAPLYASSTMYLFPLWAVFASMGRTHHKAPWLAPAALLGLAVLFMLLRWMVLPEFRRVRWLVFVVLMAFVLAIPILLNRSLSRRRADHRQANHPGQFAPAPSADQR